MIKQSFVAYILAIRCYQKILLQKLTINLKNKYDLLFTISKSSIGKEALFSLKKGLIDQNSISTDVSLNSQYQKNILKIVGNYIGLIESI